MTCTRSRWLDGSVPRLDERSYRGLLEAIHTVREVVDPDRFGPVALSEIGQLVPSEVLSFNEVDPANQRVAFVLDPPEFPTPPDGERVLTAHAGEHPLIAYAARTGDGSARKISDFLTQDEWHASNIYREFYALMGVEYQMSIALPARLPIVVGIALNRSDADFTERERFILDLLRPHLAQSWRQAREHRRIQSLLEAASGVLGTAGLGVIVLADPLHELTSGALIQLYRFFGRPGRVDPLPQRVSRWVDRQRAVMSGGGGGLARPLSASRDGHRLVLRFLPAAAAHPEAVLLSEDIVRSGPNSLEAMGLTAREADVLSAVATGATNAEIGERLHIAPSTVKKHLDNVYAKLGVSRRTGAAAIMLEMLGHHAD
jgi:DNA-binding CsgD family transcriptional regulator